jgi:hypothetical protein
LDEEGDAPDDLDIDRRDPVDEESPGYLARPARSPITRAREIERSVT